MKNLNPIASLQFLGILCLAVALSTCKSQNDALTKTDYLTGSAWKMTVFTITPGMPVFDSNFNITGYNTDMLAYMGDCAKDDTFKFDANKVINFNEGAVKCDVTSPQTATGTWNLNAAETLLTMTIDGIPIEYTVMELTADVMKLKYYDTEFSFVGEITYSH